MIKHFKRLQNKRHRIRIKKRQDESLRSSKLHAIGCVRREILNWTRSQGVGHDVDGGNHAHSTVNRDNINVDAKYFENSMKALCSLVVCAICGTEVSIGNSVFMNEKLVGEISKTGLKMLYKEIVDELKSSSFIGDVKYAAEIEIQLTEEGLVNFTEHICKQCRREVANIVARDGATQEPNICGGSVDIVMDGMDEEDDSSSTDTDHVDHKDTPSRSVLHGKLTGNIPLELACLTELELSMISLLTPWTKVVMQGGLHFHARPTVYTIMNDVVEVVKQLPMIPTIEQVMILKSCIRGDNDEVVNVKECGTFRPFFVKRGLEWLCAFNWLYADIVPVFDSVYEWEDGNSIVNLDNCSIVLSDDDEADVEKFRNRSGIPPKISISSDNEADRESEVLLVNESEREQYGSHECIVRQAVGVYGGSVVRDVTRLKFCSPISCPFFWEGAFVRLYPFGRGGMDDPRRCGKKMHAGAYAKEALMCGIAQRRFERTSSWLFSAYTYEMKRRNGSVSYVAACNSSDDSGISADDMLKVMAYLKAKDGNTNVDWQNLKRQEVVQLKKDMKK